MTVSTANRIVESQCKIKWKPGLSRLIHVKIDLDVMEDGDAPIYNTSGYSGMIYDIFESTVPRVSSNLHSAKNIKPWTFSQLKPCKIVKSSSVKGFYNFSKGEHVSWFFNTIDPNIVQLLIHFQREGKNLHFYSVPLKMSKIFVDDHSRDAVPDDIETITLQLHSPAVFYKKKGDTPPPFTAETIFKHQLQKIEKIGLIESGWEFNDIIPFVRILRDDTFDFALNVSREDGKGVSFHIGRSGFLTFKISGDTETRETIFEILRLSTYIGMGVRSSMGFGHCSLKSYN